LSALEGWWLKPRLEGGLRAAAKPAYAGYHPEPESAQADFAAREGHPGANSFASQRSGKMGARIHGG
jgi:hypothetical protein